MHFFAAALCALVVGSTHLAVDAPTDATTAFQPAPKKTKSKTKKTDNPKKTKRTTKKPAAAAAVDGLHLEVSGEARLGVGVISREGIHRTLDGAPTMMTVVGAQAEPLLRWSVFQLSLPSKVEQRETWGAHLSRTDASTALALEVKPWRQLRAAIDLGLAGSQRPEWLDPYQPVDDLPDHGLVPTDRLSHVDTSINARVLAIPIARTFARFKYDFVRTTSVQDPAFDPIERPNHLTPRDRDEQELQASIKSTFGSVKPSLAVGVFRREWFFVFARDEGSGATHAGPGGADPNPLQVLQGLTLEPEVELVLLGGAVVLDIGWRLRLIDDVFQGYYSALDQQFSLGADVAIGPPELACATRSRFAFTDVAYGERSYQQGDGHPPLDFGDRRSLRKASLSFDARFPARASIRAFVDVAAFSQVTNFPDYAPRAFPAKQAYDVDWDYQSARALFGVEMQLDPDAS